MAIDDVLQYEGKSVVVTGAASGMGAAATRILVALGAEVFALDIKAVDAKVSASLEVDLRDPNSIDRAVVEIAGPVHAVFSVAGLPGKPFSDLDTVLANFVGARHLIESLVPAMPAGSAIACVASNAGLGWQQEFADLLPVISIADFEGAQDWCESNLDRIMGGYIPSKKLLNAWVAWRAPTLLEEHGIRLNCTNPGPTQTGMMPALEAISGADVIDRFVGPSNRRSSAEEQAWPIVFLNSPRASYVAGEALHVDGGFLSAMATGQSRDPSLSRR